MSLSNLIRRKSEPKFTAEAGHVIRPLYAEERAALQAYLEQINETDPDLVPDFWNQCQSDPAALSFWLTEAAKKAIEWQRSQKAIAALQG